MVLVPLVLAALWLAIERARQGARADPTDRAPLVPGTAVGRLALASLLLLIAVALASAAFAVALVAGAVMLVLASYARWGRHDRASLLVVPLVFGAWLVAVPVAIEVWNAVHAP